MSPYHCKHCGATAISKCVNCRSIFPDDGFDAMLSNVLKYKITFDLVRQFAEVQLTVHVPIQDTLGSADAEVVQYALTMINKLTPEQIKNYSCNHDWVISEGTCMFGCCVAETTKEGVPQLDGRN